MKALKSCVLLVAGLLVLCSAQNDPVIPPTSEPPATTTTTTTAAPSTSTPAATTTTEPPHTTTAAPATTTTAAPPTTSTAGPSTTPAPVPEPDVGTWTYTNKTSNQTCLLVQMALQLNVSTLDAANKSIHMLYDLPKDAIVANGSCAGEVQFMQLAWNQNMLNLSFAHNATEHEFSLTGVKFVLNVAANQSLTLVNGQTLFKTPMDMSYHCNRAQQLNLTVVGQPAVNATVTVAKLQFEAFHNKKNAKFSIAKDCDAIDTPDIVPIAVGCALILLIVIVLIAYLVGRRSTRSRGYLSM